MIPTDLGPRPSILVLRLRRLGDLLLLSPTLRALRRRYPAAQLDVLVSSNFALACDSNPHLDHVWRLSPGAGSWMRTLRGCRQRRYDAVLDFQSSPRSVPLVVASGAPIRVGWRKRGVRDWAYTHHAEGWDEPIYVARNFLRFAAAVGVSEAADLQLEVAITARDHEWATALLQAAALDPRRPLLALSVVANVDRKRWPAERYAHLADRLIEEHDAQLVLTNGPQEIEQVRAVVERMHHRPALWNYGPTTLGGLAAIYQRCALWIGNDGGPKHVATAAGCPTVVVIKKGDERYWTDTRDPQQLAVYDSDPPPDDPDSVQHIRTEQVLSAARHLLARNGGSERPAGTRV